MNVYVCQYIITVNVSSFFFATVIMFTYLNVIRYVARKCAIQLRFLGYIKRNDVSFYSTLFTDLL